jgi:hypothetical protein
MKPLCCLVTSIIIGAFAITSVGAAKLRFVKPNDMVREVQEMQKAHVLTVPRKLGLFKNNAQLTVRKFYARSFFIDRFLLRKTLTLPFLFVEHRFWDLSLKDCIHRIVNRRAKFL